jgi:hypothetical protein
MLIPDEDGGYAAFDYLVDVTESSGDADPVPAQAWEALIDAADPGEAEVIGWSAYFSQAGSYARAAFGKALNGGQLTAAAGLADQLRAVPSHERTAPHGDGIPEDYPS